KGIPPTICTIHTWLVREQGDAGKKIGPRGKSRAADSPAILRRPHPASELEGVAPVEVPFPAIDREIAGPQPGSSRTSTLRIAATTGSARRRIDTFPASSTTAPMASSPASRASSAPIDVRYAIPTAFKTSET